MQKCIIEAIQVIQFCIIFSQAAHTDVSLPLNKPKMTIGTDLASNDVLTLNSPNLASNFVNLDDNRHSISPLTNSQIIFLNTVTNVQQPGIHNNRNMYNLPGNQTPRITAQNLRDLDWTKIDRRTEEG